MKSSGNAENFPLHQQLREFAKSKNLSLAGLARLLGMAPQSLNPYLHGRKVPGPSLLSKLEEIGFEPASAIRKSGVLLSPSINCFLIAMGLSEAMAARLFQVAPETISAWLDGTSQPDYPQLALMFSQIAPMAMACRAAHPSLGEKSKNEAVA